MQCMEMYTDAYIVIVDIMCPCTYAAQIELDLRERARSSSPHAHAGIAYSPFQPAGRGRAPSSTP